MSTLRVGITGQVGFVGYHLWHHLGRLGQAVERVPFEDAYFSDEERLREFAAACDVIVHLAAMNRGDENELYATNVRLVEQLLQAVDRAHRKPHILFSSSIQESLDNPYGRSKMAGKKLLEQWGRKTGARVTTLVIPNVFGPFCRPRYNSVVATFSHQLTHEEEPSIQVDKDVPLIFVQDLVELMGKLVLDQGEPAVRDVFVPPGTSRMVSALLETMKGYRDAYIRNGIVPPLGSPFEKALFNTFRSYIDPDRFNVKLKLHSDTRGYLCETVKCHTEGQTFFSVTRPGITRGNHYHLRKVERFTVVQGDAMIRLRKIGTSEVHEYRVTGTEPSFIDMPVLYTHNIQNVGSTDLMTLFWSNEIFDPADPDTYPESV